jgi:hypothetical protein
MKHHTQSLLLIFSLLSVLAVTGCDREPNQRQEIIERYTGGEKKTVATYSGSGENEKLIMRKTFDSEGELLLIEDLSNGVITEWQALHPELKTSEGLKEYFQGKWEYENKPKYSDKTLRTIFKIDGNTSTQTYTDGEVNVWKFKFYDDFSLEMIIPNEVQTAMFQVEPVTKDILKLKNITLKASPDIITLKKTE